MVLYRYRALGVNGEILNGCLVARGREDVLAQLSSLGLDPLKISRDFSLLLDKRAKNSLFMFFYLDVLLSSNVSLIQSIALLKECSEGSFVDVVGSIEEDIKRGVCFSAALNRYRNYFDPVIIALIQVGETTGNLENNVTKIRQHLEEQYTYQKKLLKNLRYPVALLAMFFVVLFVFCSHVIPEIAVFFEESEKVMSQGIKVLIEVGKISWDIVFLWTASIVSIFLFAYFAFFPHSRLWAEKIFFSFCPLRGWVSLCIYKKFFMILSILCGSQMEFIQCLDIAHKKISSLLIFKQIALSLEAIRGGKSVTEAFQSTNLDPLYLKLLALGEQSGNLPSMVRHIYKMMDQVLEQKSQNFLRLIEPVSIGCIGLFLFLLVNAVFIPLYQHMGNIIHGL